MSIFSNVKSIRRKKNNFNLSHDNMFTSDIGTIVPCFVHYSEIPNSDLKVGVSQITRFQALLAPLQHQVNAYIHFWKVPYRLIDSKFPEFISGGTMRTGDEYIGKYFTPLTLIQKISFYIQRTTGASNFETKDFFESGSLWDMLGFPVVNFMTLQVDPTRFNDRAFLTYFWIFAQRYINLNIPLICTIDDIENNFIDVIENWRTETNADISDYLARCLVMMRVLFKSHFCLHTLGKDYFTSSLPFVQVGDPVTLNLIGEGEVHGSIGTDVTALEILKSNYIPDGWSLKDNPEQINIDGVVKVYPENNDYLDVTGKTLHKGDYFVMVHNELGADGFLKLDNNVLASFKHGALYDQDGIDHNLYVDYSEAQAITIEELRVANALQSLKESFARFGTRFQEWLKGFYNQDSSDRTLQLPQYLGGGKVPINVSEIEQTSSSVNDSVTGDGTPLGTLAGKAIGLGGNFCGFKTHIEEPSLIIGLFFLKPKTVYSNQGVNRFTLKLNDLFDYFNPKTEHLGEQEVFDKELYYNSNNRIFGYQSRYAEYKFMKNEVHGQFMSSLNFWHMARIFSKNPTLSKEFIYTNPQEYTRPFAITEVEDVKLDNVMNWLHFEVRYLAPMSKFGTPMLLN